MQALASGTTYPSVPITQYTAGDGTVYHMLGEDPNLPDAPDGYGSHEFLKKKNVNKQDVVAPEANASTNNITDFSASAGSEHRGNSAASSDTEAKPETAVFDQAKSQEPNSDKENSSTQAGDQPALSLLVQDPQTGTIVGAANQDSDSSSQNVDFGSQERNNAPIVDEQSLPPSSGAQTGAPTHAESAES